MTEGRGDIDLEELACRVEGLNGPSREVDAEIAKALDLPHGQKGGWYANDSGDHWVVMECAGRFTASLDAAMTLIPEGERRWSMDRHLNGDPLFGEYQARIALDLAADDPEELSGQGIGDGATPALALTAAALRARTALAEYRGGV